MPSRTGGFEYTAANRRRSGTASGSAGTTFAGAGSLGIARAEVERPAVHVDRPDPGFGVAQRQRDRDRAVAAPDVDDLTRRNRADGPQQEIRPEVEVAVGEDAAIGVELEAQVRQARPESFADARRPSDRPLK